MPKLIPAQLIERAKVELLSTWCLYPYRPALMALEGILHGTIKKANLNSASSPATFSGDLPERYAGTILAQKLGEKLITI